VTSIITGPSSFNRRSALMSDHVIQFHRLSFVPDGQDVVVGRPDTGSYAVLPSDGAELLRRLAEGMSADQAADWYEGTFGEPVDLGDFLESMDDLGFLRSGGEPPAPAPVPRFQGLGRALFSWPAWIAYLLTAAACMYLLARNPDLRPRPAMVYFTSSLVAVQLVVLFGQTPLAFLHESFHVLALRRLGLPSKLSVSNRLTYVVFETQSSGLLSVPRNRRYLPFLAGILLDLQVFFILDLIASASRSGTGFAFAGRLCLALSYVVAARIGWQFLLYLRTDLYYVLATALNCQDLHDASSAIFVNRIRRAFRRTARIVDEEQWTERDRRVGAWYGWFLVIGYAAAIGLFIAVFVPVVLIYIERDSSGLLSDPAGARFWNSVVSLAIIVFNIGLPIFLARRKRRVNTSRGPRPSADSSGVV
jgi:hypothetical protein